MSIKIAVTNEKGGCAKTTTAVNLAAILGERGYKTLLVDMDYQSYASHYLNRYDEDSLGILEVMKGSPVQSIIKQTDFENLYLLPSTISFSVCEDLLTQLKHDNKDYISVLSEALLAITEDFDYIIIDSPPNGIHLKENIHKFSDYLILPTIPDDYAVHSLLCKASEMITVKNQVNPRLKVLGVLIVMYERNKNKMAYTEALKQQDIFPCFDTVIRKNTTLSAAINSRQPINYYDRRCNGTKDYNTLADEIITATQEDK